MATYTHKEVANSPASYWGDAMGSNYTATATLITIINSDTTLTKAHGAFAIVNGSLVGGTITSLERTSANGAVVYETLTGFTRGAVSFLNDAPDQKLLWIMWKSADTLTGYSGDDILNGYDDLQNITHPVDTLIGGKGDDTYIVKFDFDNVIENPDEGFDTIKTFMNEFTLPANVEKLVKESATPFHGVGNELDNTLIAMTGSEVHLEGLDGNDTFYIDAGTGGAKGGIGNDVYHIYNTYGHAGASEKAGEGYDKVFTGIDGYSLSDNIEELHLTGNVGITVYSNSTGAKIFGTDKSDSLVGGDGSDEFHGQGGTNTLVGGKGDDTYYIESATDYASELANEGNDTVKTTLTTWKLMPNLENLIFLSGPSVGRIGTGNDLPNYIVGAEKGDALYGLGGGDLIDGGAGIDHLVGGEGGDMYYVDNAADVVVELADEGDDYVYATSATYTLSANVENLTFSNAISHVGHGNELDNTFDSESGSDTFYGYAGNDKFYYSGGGDVFFGGIGDDKYWVFAGDSVVELANEGIDTVSSLATKYTLSGNVENLIQYADHGIGIGNDLDNDMTLSGYGDELHGRGGNDTLRMYGANKLMDGGEGDDTVVVSGSLSEYSLQDVGGGKIVMLSSYGTDTLIDVEHIEFYDGTIHVNDGNPLFDTAYYMSHNLDVFHAGANALDHFNTSGWHEGRDPNAWFDSSGYLAVNKDIAASGQNPLEHYHNTGWHEGRDPSADFDTTLYLINNPDVAASGVDPLQHFLQVGQAEGRQAYQAIGQTIVNGFDAQYYLLHNPDVAAAGVDPLQHFNTMGWQEGRNPNAWFDTAGYLSHYSDVAASGVNPLQHYEQSGWHEDRDPSAQFDTLKYLAANADVAAAGTNPLDHFLSNGIYEGRSAMGDGLWH